MLCRDMLGRVAEGVATIFSIITLVGACAVYWVLMSNFLYNIVDYIYKTVTERGMDAVVINESSGVFSNVVVCVSDIIHPIPSIGNTSLQYQQSPDIIYNKIWNLNLTAPIFLAVIFLPLVSMKSATFFTKFSALGPLSFLYLTIFVSIKATIWGVNVEWIDPVEVSYVPLAKWNNAAAMTGMLSMALFIHNCIVTIMRNNRETKNNGRDLGVAFTLVLLTYSTIAIIFYISFPIVKTCIQDNLFNNFPSSDILTFVARIFLLFQMVTVFPMLSYVLRSQFFCAINLPAYPGPLPLLILNVILLASYIVLAIILPEIGTITRFSGSVCGAVYIFALPCLLHLRSLQLRKQLSMLTIVVHIALIVFGVTNILMQFTVSD